MSSWGTRIKGWISKIFTALLIFSLVKGFMFGDGDAGQGKDDMCKMVSNPT